MTTTPTRPTDSFWSRYNADTGLIEFGVGTEVYGDTDDPETAAEAVADLAVASGLCPVCVADGAAIYLSDGGDMDYCVECRWTTD